MKHVIFDKVFSPFAGTCAPLLGVLTSLQTELAWYLQIISLLVGISVGLISLCRSLKKKR